MVSHHRRAALQAAALLLSYSAIEIGGCLVGINPTVSPTGDASTHYVREPVLRTGQNQIPEYQAIGKLVASQSNALRLFRCERKVMLLSLSAHCEIVERRGIEPLSEAFRLDAFYSNFLCHLTSHHNRNQMTGENPHVMHIGWGNQTQCTCQMDEFPTQAISDVMLFR